MGGDVSLACGSGWAALAEDDDAASSIMQWMIPVNKQRSHTDINHNPGTSYAFHLVLETPSQMLDGISKGISWAGAAESTSGIGS